MKNAMSKANALVVVNSAVYVHRWDGCSLNNIGCKEIILENIKKKLRKKHKELLDHP